MFCPRALLLLPLTCFASGLVGFLLCLTPLSMDLMGWNGATGKGVANMYVRPSSPRRFPSASTRCLLLVVAAFVVVCS